MRRSERTLGFFLSVLLALPSAGAQESHVVNPSELQRLLAGRLSQEDADREAIRQLLRRPEVREIARGARIDLVRAESAVATLDGTELRQLARQARQVDQQLAGGQSQITFTTTTIIIILLVLILIIVAVN